MRTILLALALLFGSALHAEAPAPKLTDLQRLTVQNRVLAYQLAQAQLEAVVKELAVPGYEIDLQRIDYVKKTEAP